MGARVSAQAATRRDGGARCGRVVHLVCTEEAEVRSVSVPPRPACQGVASAGAGASPVPFLGGASLRRPECAYPSQSPIPAQPDFA
jgi:hypothetical protein